MIRESVTYVPSPSLDVLRLLLARGLAKPRVFLERLARAFSPGKPISDRSGCCKTKLWGVLATCGIHLQFLPSE
jgi:hypothetical protein